MPSFEELPLRRFFTPEEANALLPEVRGYLFRATERSKRMQTLVKENAKAPKPSKEKAQEIERLRREVVELVGQIQNRGVTVKGLDWGLLDFPALRNGQTVYLCWQFDEPRVEFWHPLHTGFAGRQRIESGPGISWEWKN